MKSILNETLWRGLALVGIILGTTLFLWLSDIDWRSAEEKSTQQLIDSMADKLDQKITGGLYDPIENISESDSWGNPIRINYEEEGIGQRLELRSAGKDGSFHTDDDLIASRWLLNGAGIGKAASSYAGDVAKESAKGAAEGVKESVKESFRGLFGKDKSEGSAN
jgi:hypothetical protein